jgi:hypothetical protein
MNKRILAAIATTGALMGLVACGGNSSGQQGSGGSSGAPPAQTLVNDALAALRSAQSVRMTGGMVQNGNSLHLDVGFIKSGSLSGTLSGPFAGAQATFKLIIVGSKGYVFLDKQFFNALAKTHGIPASACATLCGKYVAVPASQFGNFSLGGLTNSIFKGNNKAVPGSTVTTVNGQPAYRVGDGHGSYLYVAENGTHYPLEITKSGTGTIFFSEWNSVPPITAPPASQVISLPGGFG